MIANIRILFVVLTDKTANTVFVQQLCYLLPRDQEDRKHVTTNNKHRLMFLLDYKKGKHKLLYLASVTTDGTITAIATIKTSLLL